VTTLEKERDYYKSECETLQDMMRRRLTAVESPATKRKGGKGKAKVYFLRYFDLVLFRCKITIKSKKTWKWFTKREKHQRDNNKP